MECEFCGTPMECLDCEVYNSIVHRGRYTVAWWECAECGATATVDGSGGLPPPGAGEPLVEWTPPDYATFS
jgi:hypothetical protein